MWRGSSLRSASERRPAIAAEQRASRRGHQRSSRSSARLSSSTLTPGSPEAEAAAVGVLVDQRQRRARGRGRARGRRGWPGCARWPPRCGVDARGRGGDGVGRDLRRGQAGGERPLAAQVLPRVLAQQLGAGPLVGPAVVEEGRVRRRSRSPTGGSGSTRPSLKSWPISASRRASVALDARAVGLARERDLADAGHGERVGEAEHQRAGDDGDQGVVIGSLAHQKSWSVRPWATGPRSRAGTKVSSATISTTATSSDDERRRVGAHRARAGGGDPLAGERAGDREREQHRQEAAERASPGRRAGWRR